MAKQQKAPRKRHSWSLRNKLLVILVLFSGMATLFSAVVSYYLATDRVKDISLRLATQNTNAAGSAMAKKLESLHDLSNDLLHTEILAEIAKRPKGSLLNDGDTDRLEAAVATQVIGTPQQDCTFEYGAIYLKNGITYKFGYSNQISFKNYEECVGFFTADKAEYLEENYTSPFWSKFEISNGKAYFIYLRFLYDTMTFQKTGVVAFAIDASELAEVCVDYIDYGILLFDDGTYVTMLGNSGKKTAEDIHSLRSALMPYQKENGSVTYEDISGETKIASYYHLTAMQGYFVAPFEFYENIRAQEMAEYVKTIIIFLCIELIVVFVIAVVASKGILRSLSELLCFVKKAESGSNELRFAATAEDEIAYLGSQVNTMLDRIRESNQEREEKLIENQLMEIQLLQQQINPHILYNTLDAVLWGLEENRYDDSTKLIYALSEFFKLSLAHGADMVTLSDEVELIRHYLSIQRLARYKDFDFLCNISEDILSYPFIKLTLQPLVENSIIHGFQGYSDEGTIMLNAWHNDTDIYLELIDDGLGMTETEVIKVNNAIVQPQKPEEFKHFGLYNINRRFSQMYGPEYGIRVESKFGEYTKILLHMPFDPELIQ